MTWISPYNDGRIIAGQGTIGVEVLSEPSYRDRHNKITWIVPTSGGGLVSRLCNALKSHGPTLGQINIVGVQSETPAFMDSIFYRGTQENVADLPTIADAISLAWFWTTK